MSITSNGKPDHKIGFKPQRDDPNGFELTDADRAAIREKARLTVAKERKDRDENALLAQYLDEERARTDPALEKLPIFLTLAGHTEYIMLDGVQYFHERLYEVVPTVFATLAEIQARGWAHEEETEVRDTKTRRRHRPPAHVGTGNFMDHRVPRDMRVSAGQLQGTAASTLLGLGK